MQDFRKLRAWHLAHTLALKIIEAFPAGAAQKVPGLRSQLIRAATSIAANLVEGCGCETREEFVRFVGIALASHAEAEGHLLLARDAGVRVKGGYGPLQRELAVLRLMIVALMRTLRRRIDEERAARDEEMAEPEHDPVDSSTP